MANELRFDGKVAIVTGAGQGLGRSYARLFASRGARVVVNDLGGAATGGGGSAKVADEVVAAITDAGGEAVASYDSVVDGEKIVQVALDSWGRVDIVVNNAGILRDTTFHKLTQEDWDLIYQVHVLGSFKVTHAAWPHLREQRYGRVVFTASAAGIYGNFGQANYAMAKLGLLGLANTLAVEGRKRNIQVNTIAPLAGSRLTETVLPKDLTEALAPRYVSPLVAWLCHEDCDETGSLFEVGGGFFGKLRWERAKGRTWRVGRDITPEDVRGGWDAIAGFEESTHPADLAQSMQPIMGNIQAGPSKGGNELIDVDAALGWEFPEWESEYTQRDLCLYALGVGAAADPRDAKDLRLVYEMSPEGFEAVPTFGVVPAVNGMLEFAKAGTQPPGMHYGIERILHGEQYTQLVRPLPPHAKLTHRAHIKDIFDKGKGALVITETRSYDEDGDLLVVNASSIYVRGAGGWGGERGPGADTAAPPDRAPDLRVEQAVAADQALLYRLSGDWNPLHVDPTFARAFGFDRPILQGLCTYGFACRHVIDAVCDGDPRYFKSIKVRFADPVFPGETLVTEIWKESTTRVLFRCKVKERDEVVISNAAVELYEEVPKKVARPKAVAVPSPAPEPAESGSADVFLGMQVYVERHPELAPKIQNVFVFRLTDPPSAWTLDLQSAGGAVFPGAAQSPDCTLELSESDFLSMTKGESQAQELYFSGKLKISGNVMASQKLDFLQKITPEEVAEEVARRKAAGAGMAAVDAPSTPTREPVAATLFAKVASLLADNFGLAADVRARMQFEVTSPDASWVVDLCDGPGAVREGRAEDATVTFTLEDADLEALARGRQSAQTLHQQGKLRIDGDILVARRLGFLRQLA